jgi:hypothetical protein
MYWDVVEVKPEPEYRLFVRFKVGISGHVQLSEDNLNGALAPLRDLHDAMYAQVSRRLP